MVAIRSVVAEIDAAETELLTTGAKVRVDARRVLAVGDLVTLAAIALRIVVAFRASGRHAAMKKRD